MNTKKEYRRLVAQTIQNRARMGELIPHLLKEHADRITQEPELDEDGDIYLEDTIQILCYGKYNNPCIGITSVYFGEHGEILMDGINIRLGITEKGYDVYPENYVCVLDFIATALNYPTTGWFENFIRRITGSHIYRRMFRYKNSHYGN